MLDNPVTLGTEIQGPDSERKAMHGEVLRAITSRAQWERRAIDFYRMRHQGIRRYNKPWATAADLHYPLIDGVIEKLKPTFLQQLVGMDTVATFVPFRQQLAAATTTAEQWFDYKIRERTNLQEEFLSWVDYALMVGRGVIKCFWDAQKARVQFEAVDPLYFIVPPHTKELQDADWVVQVMSFSESAYRRRGIYKDDDETVRRLLGNEASAGSPGITSEKNIKALREGLTHEGNWNRIIVWEHYKRNPADGSWWIYTYSPVAPEIDLREPMPMIYNHGQLPFIDFPYEIKDKGWFAPRGVAEILAPYEAYLSHVWNSKSDAMTLFNKPLFRAERDIPNSLNIRMKPGDILPYGIQAVTMPQPPLSFDQEMVSTRSIAEQRISSPDFGMGQVMDTKNRRTATEIESINAQSAQSGDMRARLCRMALGKVYKQAWSLLLQFDSEDLSYRYLEDSVQADPNALHDQYHIEPKGGIGEVNRQFLLQKAMQRKQLFANSPWIDQAELDRTILELDDPSLIKRVFRDPNLKGQDQAADETKGIPSLLLGGALPVTPDMDAQSRVGILKGYLASVLQQGNPLPPQQKLVARLNDLLTAWEQKDTNGARAERAQLEKALNAYGMSLMPQPPVIPQAAPQAPQQPAR